MVEGDSWNEDDYGFAKAVNKIKATYRIISESEDIDISKVDTVSKGDGISSDKLEASIREYKNFIKNVVRLLQDEEQAKKNNESALMKDIDELFEFEQKLDLLKRRNDKYQKIRNRNQEKLLPPKEKEKVKKAYLRVLFLNSLQPFIYTNGTDYEGAVNESILVDIRDFFNETPLR